MLTMALNYGTLPAWITVAILSAGVFMLARAAARAQSGEALEIMEASNRILSNEVGRLRLRVDELEKLPNLERLAATLAEHERGAAERAEKIIGALNKIADRLGPEAA